jgi:WXXGXW repeat (2 copies)
MRIFIRLVPLLFASFALAAPYLAAAQITVGVSVTVAPPPLPVYAQPAIPGPGYIWTPGYWAWGLSGYYWVPGTWVLPPVVGLLWTPGYWAWHDGAYLWHAGYWGPRVGFYGGIVYGFGYDGIGYHGGFWDHDHFHYNAAVNNLHGVHITNVYTGNVVNNVHVAHVSFNGGHGGTAAHASAAQQGFASEHHVAPTEIQARHAHEASADRALLSSVNHGRPAVAATPHAASFTGRGITAATRPPSHQPHAQAPQAVHPANEPAPRASTHQENPHGKMAEHGGGPRGGEPHGGGPQPHEHGHGNH